MCQRNLWRALVLVFLASTNVWAQGSGSSRTNPTQTQRRPQTAEEFAQEFWRFVMKPEAPFTKWQTAPSGEGQGPHGKPGKVYLNSIAAGNTDELPAGSILVREDYAADPKTRTGFSIMYRVKGNDPKNYDWYWIQFLENGSVVKAPAESGGKPMMGRVTSCIECHQKAPGDKRVFFSPAPTADAK
jgi:hypothetical protein